MKMRNLLFVMAVCLMVVFGVQFKANAATAIATVGPNSPAPDINFTGGVVGIFNLSTQNAFIRSKVGFGFNPNVTVAFTPLRGVGIGGYSFNPATQIWYLILTDPNGLPSQFRVIDNGTGNPLLVGQYSRAILHGRSGSSSLALTLFQDNVTYNVALSPWFPIGGIPQGGSLSISILSRVPVVATPNGPGAFLANGDINFGAQ